MDGLLKDADHYARVDLNHQLAPFLGPLLSIEAIRRLDPYSDLPTRPGIRERQTREYQNGDINA